METEQRITGKTDTNQLEFLSGGGELGEMMRSYNWSETPLGPTDKWPQSLRTCVRIMLTSRQPIWIGWGKELIKLYNDPYKAIVGGKHPRAMGQPASVVWQDIWRDIEPMLKKVMVDNEGTYVESQLLIMERNGYPEETYYTFSYTPIPGDDGKTAGMFCANTDDTERIISERQLKTLTQLGKNLTDCQTNEEIIKRTIDTLKENPYDFPFAYFRTIKDGYATMAYATELGESSKVVQRSVDLSDGSEVAEKINRAIHSRKIEVFENVQQKIGKMPSGGWSIPPQNVIVVPIVQTGIKDPYGVLVIGQNPYRLLDEKYLDFFSLVADQIATSFADAHVLDEERKRAEALAEIDRAKTTFFSNISHEFRTPLTLLLGPIADALNDENTIPENKVRMDVAYRNALRMQKLVNTLLEFSRIEAGRVEGKFARVDICALTEDLASTFRSAIERAGMQLIIDKEPIDNEVYVDPDMWERIILNLMSNAFKYSTEGSIRIQIQQEEDVVSVSVTDTGIGIPAEHIGKIFDRFHRVANTGGRSQEGTGIGLAMVKELVKIHGGSIGATSVAGKGSTFTVTIPTGKQHLPADKIAENQPVQTGTHANAYVEEATKWLPETQDRTDTPARTTNEPGDNRYTIMLADDNADMRDYVSRLLADTYNVMTAIDGADAYEQMLTRKPDLLLSDIMMPKLDGFGLLKQVRAHRELKNIPVIFLSARAGDEAKLEGLDAGADDYMVKPFSAKELLGRVANHIRINKVRRETEQQFYQLFLQAPAIINVFKGPEHRYELFHPRNKALLGDVDYTGMTLKEALPELEEQGVPETLDRVYRNGETIVQTEHKVVLPNGEKEPTERYFNIIYQPWYDINHKIQGVLNFAIDVTEDVNNRKEIERSEQRFRLLSETLPQLVWMTDGNGERLYTSSRWKDYTGVEAGPDTWKHILHPNDYGKAEHLWQNALSNKSAYKMEVRLRSADGSYNWFYGQTEPIFDAKGEVEKWIGSLTNIHDQKELEVRLEQLVEERTKELQRSNDDLQQFAHVASHDLKEPVRKIKTFAGRLQTEYGSHLPEKGKLFLDKVQSATDRMYAMIDGVLEYSTLNAKTEDIQTVDLNEIIAQIETDLEVTMQQKNVVVHTTPLPSIEGANVLLYQLFYNIISNSLKFTRADVPPIINITATTENNESTITVSDNGIGFEQEYADKIFDTFTRLNAKDLYEGTGLGLALCKKIADRHSGTISAISTPGNGATFIIKLPLRQAKNRI